MTTEELITIINNVIDDEISLSKDTPLIGGESSIDSMNLVQICIELEEKANYEGFQFDWTSEKAMSILNSIFKTPETLTKEYNRQKQA